MIFLGGCGKGSAAAHAPKGELAVPVTLAPVKVESVQRSVEIVGSLFGDEEATISSKVMGKIVAIHRDMGDRAAPGEPLATVEQTDYQLARNQKAFAVREILAKLGLKELPPGDIDVDQVPTVQRARLQAENARAKRDRGKKLHDQRPPLMSDQDYADIETAYEVAQSNYEVEILTARSFLSEARTRNAELAMFDEKLADTIIRAPELPGVATARAGERDFSNKAYAISARTVSLGEIVREGTAAFKVVKDNPIKLRAAVPERYVASVAVGQKTRLFVAAYPDAFEGAVARINPSVDPANRTFQVEILVPNRQRMLRPGAFARAFIETHRDPEVVFAPLESVLSFAGSNKVFTVENGRAVELAVQVGGRQGESIEVTSGLRPGTQVVVRGTSKLAGGVPVVIQAAPASQPGPDSEATQASALQ